MSKKSAFFVMPGKILNEFFNKHPIYFCLLGGLFIGMIETVATIVPGMAPYTVAIEFLVLIVVLLVRPTGILGKKRREKV